jgi:hypothetical protein
MNTRLRAGLTLVAAIMLGVCAGVSTGNPLLGYATATAVALVHSPLATRRQLCAAGDPIKLGALATNGVFLMTSEVGIIVDSFRRQVESKKLDFYDGSLGYTSGVIYHDFSAKLTIKGACNGSTGIMAASVGVVLTVANNASAGNGVATGGVYSDSIEFDHQAQNLREITVNATQRASIA